MRRLLLNLFCLTLPALSMAATTLDSAADEPKKTVRRFFQALATSDADSAIDELVQHSPVLALQFDPIRTLKQHAVRTMSSYGAPLGVQLVEAKKFGSSVIRLTYLQQLEKRATIWTFNFYRPQSEWFLAGIGIDDESNPIEQSQLTP